MGRTVHATLRAQVRDLPPSDFAVRPAWVRLIQVLRAHRRATGQPTTLQSRAAVERALDTECLLEIAAVRTLKEQLRALVRDLGERDLGDQELRALALAIDAQVSGLLPRIRTEPVVVQVSGWPEEFSRDQQERMLRRPLSALATLPPAEAAALIREFDGLVLGGRPLSVSAALTARQQLPAVPRDLRAKPMLRRRQSAWLPHLDEDGRRSLTDRSRAQQHARLIDAAVVIDACCGCGGNAIAFALAGKQVIAIEQDAHRIGLARRNAAQFGVSEQIRFVCGDLQEHLAPSMAQHPDCTVFVDPPWRSGAGIVSVPRWPDLLPGGAGTATTLQSAKGLLLKLPRSFDLATLPGGGWQVEWGFGDGAQSSVVLMITALSTNRSLHRPNPGAI